jgi:O-antigen/teichoic acid export membrane protein
VSSATAPPSSKTSRRPFAGAADRNPLPEGTIAVGLGLVVAGLSAYGFLSVSSHALGGDRFASLSALWFLTFILAPGVFLPVEQEVGRALAHRRALHLGSLPVVRKAAVLALGLVGIVLVILLTAAPLGLVERLLHDSWFLMACLVLAFLGYATQHFLRGVLSGHGDFGRYGLLMGLDGSLRVFGAISLSVIGVEHLGAYGLLVGLPPFLAAYVAGRGRRRVLAPGPEASWSELTPNLGWLLVGSVLASALVNAGPLATNLLADPDERQLVTSFAAAVLIARVPLFLFQAVQAALLPKLARLAAQNELTEFRTGLRKLLVVVVGVGVLGTGGAFAIGPWAVSTFFATDAEIGRRTLTMLALASAVYMLAVAMAQAVIALHGHARVALGWGLAMAAFLTVTAVSTDDLLLRVESGQVSGSVTAAVVFALFLRLAVRRGAQPTPDSLLEAVYDMPVEP